MAVQVPLLERLLEEAEGLSPLERVSLIQRLVERLLPNEQNGPHIPLQYGKYAGSNGNLSTEEDFKIAEWHAEDGEAELDDP